MSLARNDGLGIHYVVVGEGPPLVLHHGFSGSLQRWIWSGYLAALEPHFQVVLMDARGHGQSDKPQDPAAYTLEAQVSDVVAVLDDLRIDRAAYWGFSMGGRIGFGLAKDAPARVSALVIGAAHPFARRLPAGERPDGSDPKAFVAALYKRTGADLDALPEEVRHEIFANDFRALAAVQQDWPALDDVLPTMTMPCLLYVGEDDPYLEKMRDCVRRMPPTAELVTLPGLDHGTGFRESGRVLPHVLCFLKETASGRKLPRSRT